VRALVYLQGAAEFIENNAYRQSQFALEFAKVKELMRTSDDYFRLNKTEDVSRLLGYLAEHGVEFKTVEGFLRAYNDEKLPPGYVSREVTFHSLRTGEQSSETQLSTERFIPKDSVDKFIELRDRREHDADAKRKREQRSADGAMGS
jgi:hypothetical protein